MDDESPEFDPPTIDLPGHSHDPAPSDSAVSLRQQPLPLQDWDRYRIVEFLGAGGMGTVYKAQDPRLNRFVALKFIRDTNTRPGSDLTQRFNREARAQASIDHEHICKIYEVGEADNRPYISMQYIEGVTLTRARDQMTLPHKVKVIKQVAEALHAAHRHGLIHRDVKPGNIMVEQMPDGGWRPYVLDFGLADEIQATGGMLSGAREGTPAFMSPEQARGEMQLLDRRTDVYSLGATLYDLLTGQPPFGKGSNEEILLSLLVAEPRPIRQIKRSIPDDLEKIVIKCLEKDPAERYESAKALADDLQRYLDDEPIMAQGGFIYRLKKKAQKNKMLVGTLTVATLSILVLIGVGIRSRVHAAQQVRQAQEFGQTIKEIEMFLRYAYALKLHDTRLEKKVIRDRMQRIQDRMSKMDGEAAAMAHYALGRGHLALQEFEPALEHLQGAHRGKLQTAEVHYALGRTLGEIYYKKLKDLQRTTGTRFFAEKQKLDKLLLEPALYHLRQTSGLQGESRPFAEGLLAFYSRQLDEALLKAQEALAQEPWIYEAKKLQGNVFYSYGFDKLQRGLYEEARSDFRRAAELYHDAAEMARSDSTIHGAEADMWVQVMDIDKMEGLSPKEAYEQALAACDRAMQSDPENGSALRKKVWAHIRWAEYQSTHGEDPRTVAHQAIDAAQQAMRLDSRNAFPYDQMGLAYLFIARAEYEHGLDPSESEKRAADAFQRSVEVNPMFAWAWNDYGLLHTAKAEWLARRGADYRDELADSISKLQRAIEVNPDYHIAYSNLVDVYQLLARYEMDHGRSPEAWIQKAIEMSTRSLSVNPNFYETYRNLASAYAIRAQYESALGRNPQPHLNQALEELAQAIKANANDAETHLELAKVYWLSARDLLEHHRDLDEPLSKGLQAIQRSILISPNSPDSYLLHAQLLLLAAQNDAQHGKSPLPSLQQAQSAASRARDLNPKIPGVYLGLGEIGRATAEWKRAHAQSGSEELADGLSAIEQALGLNPTLSQALAVRGALLLLEARGASGVQRKQAAALAAQALQQALGKNPLLDRQFGALLNEAIRLHR